ncbi:hypothetical protein C8R45DRAFT_945467 [Mycena sanguinolenta]|nr:hypothetical protein C8R45DRAFT_945467 [Mycena sanguinolenta]
MPRFPFGNDPFSDYADLSLIHAFSLFSAPLFVPLRNRLTFVPPSYHEIGLCGLWTVYSTCSPAKSCRDYLRGRRDAMLSCSSWDRRRSPAVPSRTGIGDDTNDRRCLRAPHLASRIWLSVDCASPQPRGVPLEDARVRMDAAGLRKADESVSEHKEFRGFSQLCMYRLQFVHKIYSREIIPTRALVDAGPRISLHRDTDRKLIAMVGFGSLSTFAVQALPVGQVERVEKWGDRPGLYLCCSGFGWS